MSLFSTAVSDDGVTVAVGANGLILRSTDGEANWTTQTSGTTNDFRGVAWGIAYDTPKWIAVGENGVMRSSSDGITWGAITPVTGETLYSVTWAEVFLTVGGAGVLFLSDDLGATWDAKSSGTTEDLLDISFGSGVYTIVGTNDTVIVGTVSTLEQESFIQEGVGLILSGGGTGTLQHVLSEDMEIADGYNWESEGFANGEVQYIYQTEGLGAFDYSEDPNGAFNHVISESFEFLTTFIGNAGFRDTLEETLSLEDTPTRDALIFKILTETVQASTALTVAEIEVITELLNLSPTASAGGTFNHIAAESLSMNAIVVVAWAKLLSETVTVTDTAVSKFEIAVGVVEDLLATGAASSVLQAVAAVAVSMEFTETLQAGKGGFITETTTLTPVEVNTIIGTIVQLEQATIAAVATQGLIISTPINETVTLDDTATLNQIILDVISEGLVFDLSFGLAGEVYSGWVMNVDNFAVSEYQNYPFNSFAKIGNSYYGANENGLYLLEGSDDAGTDIDAQFTTGKMSFGPNKSRVANSYLAMRNDGRMLLKTITDDDVEHWHEITSSDWTLNDKRVKLGRGVKSRYWQFTICNADGADFEIDELVLIPILLKRR